MSALMDKVKSLPAKPGCYIYKNKQGDIIYVGKSKCLKKRVRQYFRHPEKAEGKIYHLVKEIHDFDYIVTETETDALLLECRLIKQIKPKYNAMMKRSKIYPFINIKIKNDYPGIYVSADADEEGAISFGCFYNRNDAQNTVDLINSVWKTPTCSKQFFTVNSKKKACFNIQIGKCNAPCCGNISIKEYKKTIKEIIEFLRGNNSKKILELKREMTVMSKKMEFEKAALIRNKMIHLQELQRRTKRFNTNLKGKDYCVFLRAYHESSFSIFYIHDGITLTRTIIDIGETIDYNEVKDFALHIIEKDYNVNEGDILSMCITAIGADKLYVDVTNILKKKNIDILAERIFSSYTDFYQPV